MEGDRRKIATMKKAFLSLPEEEAFKYFEIFKKNLSGSIGKNLITMPFPTDSEFDGGTQEFLLKLRNSKLEDDELIDQFYDKVIENFDYTGNYLILLIHDTYVSNSFIKTLIVHYVFHAFYAFKKSKISLISVSPKKNKDKRFWKSGISLRRLPVRSIRSVAAMWMVKNVKLRQ